MLILYEVSVVRVEVNGGPFVDDRIDRDVVARFTYPASRACVVCVNDVRVTVDFSGPVRVDVRV